MAKEGVYTIERHQKGIQTLVSNDCPYICYIHCFAHRIRLSLVTALKEVIHIHQLFTKLTDIFGASCKRNEKLQVSKATEFIYD